MPLFSRSGARNFFWKSKKKPPMDQPSNAVAMMQTYVDFEPFCTWQREEVQETLTVRLPEFRKEQLKVHIISTAGLLRISGERPIDKTRTSRFIKEIKISCDCDPARIHAKFSRGLLHIVLPKKVSPAADLKPGLRMAVVKAAAVLMLLAIGAHAIFKRGTSEAGAGACQSFS